MTSNTPDPVVDTDRSLEPWLRKVLRCPQCLGELRDDTSPSNQPELVCVVSDCRRAYPIEDQVPVLLVDEARLPE